MKNSKVNILLWVLFVGYIIVTLTFPFLSVPPLVYAGSVVILGSLFAVTHGIMRYGIRGMAVFIGLCLVISNIFENLSIQTGFPFGFYHYTDLLGPKLFEVPLLIGPAYFATGYLSWTIGNVLLEEADKHLKLFKVIALPIVASFIMVMWDLVMDPTSSTINHLWIWQSGGGFFGVPLTNYLGWFLTVYIFFQFFAFYLYKFHSYGENILPKSYWYMSTILYLTIGLSPIVNFTLDKGGQVADSTGYLWNIHDISETSVITSLYTMIFMSVLTIFNLLNSRSKN